MADKKPIKVVYIIRGERLLTVPVYSESERGLYVGRGNTVPGLYQSFLNPAWVHESPKAAWEAHVKFSKESLERAERDLLERKRNLAAAEGELAKILGGA